MNSKSLNPPKDLYAIHGFSYGKNQIILLYSTSVQDDSWIEVYKTNHVCNDDIVDWCLNHGIQYEILDKRKSKFYKKFMRERQPH